MSRKESELSNLPDGESTFRHDVSPEESRQGATTTAAASDTSEWLAYQAPTHDAQNAQGSAPVRLVERTVTRRGMLGALVGAVAVGAVSGGIGGALVATDVASRAAASNTRSVTAPVATASQAGATVKSVAAPGVANTIATSVYKAANDSVVSLMVVSSRTGPRGIPGQQEGEGSGIIVDAMGHILTNNHVVAGSSDVQVTFVDGSQVQAKVIGTDPGNDLALVQVQGMNDKLHPATLGDSDAVHVGEAVVAIGTPFGLEHTVTAGIISATGRTYAESSGRPLHGLLQTDAPINPGNSGGPLFNSNAEVIGITTAIESPVRGSVGVGFAIPINQAKRLLPQLNSGEPIQHPYMGIGGVALTPQLARTQGLSLTKGILLTQVAPAGPAAKAGLKAGTDASGGSAPKGGDVITQVDGHAVGSVEDLSAYLDGKRVGDTITLTIVRNGQETTVPLTLGAWPNQQTG